MSDLQTAPLAMRLPELARRLGVCTKTVKRARLDGRFPEPDQHLGAVPLWSVRTVERWLSEHSATR